MWWPEAASEGVADGLLDPGTPGVADPDGAKPSCVRARWPPPRVPRFVLRHVCSTVPCSSTQAMSVLFMATLVAPGGGTKSEPICTHSVLSVSACSATTITYGAAKSSAVQAHACMHIDAMSVSDADPEALRTLPPLFSVLGARAFMRGGGGYAGPALHGCGRGGPGGGLWPRCGGPNACGALRGACHWCAPPRHVGPALSLLWCCGSTCWKGGVLGAYMKWPGGAARPGWSIGGGVCMGGCAMWYGGGMPGYAGGTCIMPGEYGAGTGAGRPAGCVPGFVRAIWRGLLCRYASWCCASWRPS